MKRNKMMSASIAGLAAVALFAGACSDDDTISPGQEDPEVVVTDGEDEGVDTTTTTTGDTTVDEDADADADADSTDEESTDAESTTGGESTTS